MPGWRSFWSEPLEVREPDLDERPHRLLEPRLTGGLERLLVALAHLRRVDALLEPVVSRQEQLLDAGPRTFFHRGVRYSSVRILIADDEPLFAEALELLLGADERIEVVGRAGDGASAVELTRDLEPDLVLMDLSMPGMDGFSATEEIARDPGVRVLVLTGSDDPADVAKARRAGAVGYITKDQIADTLVSAILGAGS